MAGNSKFKLFSQFIFTTQDLLFLSCLHFFCIVGEKLHADIVESLEDIFGYISSKTGRIWTKLDRGMGKGERVIV